MRYLRYSNRTRFKGLIRLCIGALVVRLLWMYLHWNSDREPDDSLSHSPVPRSLETNQTPLFETTVMAHAAGFTVLENAYWSNHTWYFVTPNKQTFPEIRLVVTNAPWHEHWDDGEDTRWDDSVARVVTLKEAMDLGREFDNAEVVHGSSIVFNDRVFLNHFYHLVGEMFLGAWAAYTSVLEDPIHAARFSYQDPSFGGESVLDRLPEVTKLIFAHVPPDQVYDHAGLNTFFFLRAFPGAEWEFEEDWNARADSPKVYRFERVTIADRKSAYMGPHQHILTEGYGKIVDPVFDSLPRPKDWISSLKDRILQYYPGKISPKLPAKPVVTYLSRQQAAYRRLSRKAHQRLVAGLKVLEKEGLADVNIEEFTEKVPKDEQVAKLSRTTILIGLHGNGLTHLIWMTPDPQGRSTVFEIQQKGMFADDYAVLTETLGMEHWIFGGRSEGVDFCQRRTCGFAGVDDEEIDVAKMNYDVDVPELVRRIREELSVNPSTSPSPPLDTKS